MNKGVKWLLGIIFTVVLEPHGHCQDSRCPNADKYFSENTIKNQ